MAGRGITEDLPLGLEHPLQPGKAFLLDGAELGAVEIHRAAVHRPQYPVRDVGRPRIHEKVIALRHLAASLTLRAPLGGERDGVDCQS